MSDQPYLPCDEIIGFLWAYVAGELAVERRHEFERHLAVCPSCVAYLDSYRKTIELSHESFQPGQCEPDAEAFPEDLIHAVLAARRSG